MKVTLDRDQVAKILLAHIADNRRAFCVRDGFTVDRVEWVSRDVGCDVRIVIDEKHEEAKKDNTK